MGGREDLVRCGNEELGRVGGQPAGTVGHAARRRGDRRPAARTGRRSGNRADRGDPSGGAVLLRRRHRSGLGAEASRATGRRRAEQGVPLPVILHAYRIAGKFIWAAILAEASEDGSATTALLHASSELWFIIDDQSGSVTDAYRDAVAERARTNSQTRNAMLDVLLRGDAGDGSLLWECAATLRLPHQGTVVVAAAQAPRPGIESIPHAEDALRTRGVQSAWRVEVDAHVGVVVLTPRVWIDKLCSHLAELTSGAVS